LTSWIVYPGIALFAIGMIILSQAETTFTLLAAGAVIGLGYGTLVPSFQTIAVNIAPAHRRGLATSTYFSFFDSGIGLGSFVLGLVAAATNYHTMYIICAGIIMITAFLYYALHDKRSRSALDTKLSA
jgi:MFS family permease